MDNINQATNSEPDCDDLEPDYAGLWSVCLPTSKCPTFEKNELEDIFNKAGRVKRSMICKNWVFLRYSTKEGVLKAKELFGDSYGVRFASTCQKVKERQEKKIEDEIKHDAVLNGANKKFPMLNDEKYKQKHKKSKEKENNSSNCKNIQHCLGKRNLFVGHIESEDDFKDLMKPYNPLSMKFASRGPKNIFAFLTMESESQAKTVIRDLHNKKQYKRSLLVDFDKSNQGAAIGHSENTDSSKLPETKLKQKPQIAEPQTDFSDMPLLIDASELGPNPGKHNLDCSIYVANFPVNSLESALRKAFEKYNIIDICMVNNGNGQGCTKAFLYLATVYDVFKAIKEMNASTVFGYPLKVDVPYKNFVVKSVLGRVLSRPSSVSCRYPMQYCKSEFCISKSCQHY